MPPEKSRTKAAVITEGCFAAVVNMFMRQKKFENYAPTTRKLWGAELMNAAHPETMGALSVTEVTPAVVQGFLDGFADRPGKQAVALSALRQLEKWAIVRNHLPRQITLGVEIEDSDGGHIPWDDEHVALAEQYARPFLARAVTLAANTGQRGSDLIRMGPTDIEAFNGIDGIKLTQRKTGREVWVPITSTLAAAMATWERRPGPFLRNGDDKPWVTRQALTNAWARERENNPHLVSLNAAGPDKDHPLVMHGLRGHACVRLLRAGANTRQIADMVGMSENIVARYTRFSSQRENASAAVYHLERTMREQKDDNSHVEKK